jgi:UDP-N-acetylmuramate dehydrogenase
MGLQLQSNRRFSEFSTFGIGGPIRAFVEVSTIEEMEEALNLKLPFIVIGKGSNCLFNDRGFDGLVILNKIDHCNWHEKSVEVGAGYSFSLLGVQTARKGFSGLEFASGIPATVGGAVFMNAGANGKETCDSLKSVLFLHSDGRKEEFLRSELVFSYRTSPFQKINGAILSATFSLEPNQQARPTQLKIVEYRMKTQPLKEMSAGCIFRNPVGSSAGALIDQCGLKGLTLGGAQVSPIHANFIVNRGNATAQDVLSLIELIQKKVLEQTGIHLEPEVRLL